jgi:hypothetical protein
VGRATGVCVHWPNAGVPFVHPETGRSSAIKGLLLQKQNLGAGFFLGTTKAGGCSSAKEKSF